MLHAILTTIAAIGLAGPVYAAAVAFGPWFLFKLLD